MDKVMRPVNVTTGAWMIIVVSGLFFVQEVFSISRTLAMPTGLLLRLLILVGGLACSAFLVAVGVAVLKGLNWARMTFLVGELLVLNFAVMFLSMGVYSPTPAETAATLVPGVFYLIVLILLTRRSALTFFGRPEAPAMKAGKIVLAVFLFCVVYAGVARGVAVLGARTLSMASDRWNPVSAIANSVGEATGFPLLESSTHMELRSMLKSIEGSRSLEALTNFSISPAYEAQMAVVQHDSQVMLLWIVQFIALPILLRRH